MNTIILNMDHLWNSMKTGTTLSTPGGTALAMEVTILNRATRKKHTDGLSLLSGNYLDYVN